MTQSKSSESAELFLQRLHLRDFRSFSGTHVLDLSAPVVLLQGENGCGKSSCLSALELSLTGKVVDLKGFGHNALRYLVHRDQRCGEVKLEASVGEGSVELKSDVTEQWHCEALLRDPAVASFFRERCYLSQVQLSRLLEIYQSASDGDLPLVRFLQDLLQLDQLGALIRGLESSKHKNSLRARAGSPEYGELSRREQQLKQHLADLESKEAKAAEFLASKRLRVEGVLGLEPVEEYKSGEVDQYQELLETRHRDLSRQKQAQEAERSKLEALGRRMERVFGLWEGYSRYAEAKGVVAAEAARLPDELPDGLVDGSPWERVQRAGDTLRETIGEEHLRTILGEEFARHLAESQEDNLLRQAIAMELLLRQLVEEARWLEEIQATVRQQMEALDQELETQRGELEALDKQWQQLSPAEGREGEVREILERLLSDGLDSEYFRRFASSDLASPASKAAMLKYRQAVIAGSIDHLEAARERQNQRLYQSSARNSLLRHRKKIETAWQGVRSLVQWDRQTISRYLLLQWWGLPPGGGKEGAGVERPTAGSRLTEDLREQLSEPLAEFGLKVPKGLSADVFDETLKQRLEEIWEDRVARLRRRDEDINDALRPLAAAEFDLKELRKAWKSLESLQEKKSRLLAQQKSLEQQKDQADGVISSAKGLRRVAIELRESILAQRVDQRLNDLWRALFSRLAPDERFVPQVARQSARGDRLTLDFQAFDGGQAFAPPGAVLSSGTLNTAALSLFLALHLVERRTVPLLVLDDPVQNMDDLRVTELAAVLRRLVQQRRLQLIVAVHDPALFDFLSLELGPAAPGESLLAHRILRSGPEGGSRIETTRYAWEEVVETGVR